MKEHYKVGNLIYDPNIYDGLNTQIDDLAFYKRWLPDNKRAQILELCCGTGRLTIPIAQEGFDITGVDIMPLMLDQARQKASDSNVDISFIEADVRELNLGEQYDFVFIPFNSIHHLYKNEDLDRALNSVKSHLKEDGLFLFDCFNPNINFIAQNEKREQEIASYSTKDGRAIRIIQKMRYESSTQINRIEWHYHINGQFDSVQNMDMRMYFPQELDAHLQWNGFTILHKFGDFDEEVFHNESEKQIFVCKRFN